MAEEFYNAGLVKKFSGSAKAIKVIKQYKKLEISKFISLSSSVGFIGEYEARLCKPTVSKTAIDNYVVSFEFINSSTNSTKARKLKEICRSNKVYFIGDISIEIIGEIDSIIANCILLYSLMLGYETSKGHSYNCMGLYPEIDNAVGWFESLVEIDNNSYCYPILEMYNDMFTNPYADYCLELLDSGNSYMDCVDLFLQKVMQNINIMYPQFFQATEVLIDSCRQLVKAALQKNTYVINIQ